MRNLQKFVTNHEKHELTQNNKYLICELFIGKIPIVYRSYIKSNFINIEWESRKLTHFQTKYSDYSEKSIVWYINSNPSIRFTITKEMMEKITTYAHNSTIYLDGNSYHNDFAFKSNYIKNAQFISIMYILHTSMIKLISEKSFLNALFC
jgi:hypothetical protein